ncbi:BrxA family protein [Chishuiella sp.]|uniref:BrxA family protein n=1 Tax=Chishuiella sp. TaxID=1969467 RepID=UPI0028A92D3A|nr:BrxA family protein [Chishuiella sp.]
MQINSNINIIGGLPEFNLIKTFLIKTELQEISHVEYSDIRTLKSVNRFKKAITESFISTNENLNHLVLPFIEKQSIEENSYLLFLLFSFNNELFSYLNNQVFFPVYYSGRKIIKKEEVIACLVELQKTEDTLKSWSESTITTTASKYLTLLKKFELLSGVQKKEIVYKNLSSEEFLVFAYFLTIAEENTNKINSDWIKYSFYEQEFFVEKVLNKQFIQYVEIQYNGDSLKINPTINYDQLYEILKSA